MGIRVLPLAALMFLVLAVAAPAEDIKILKNWKGPIDDKAAKDVGEAKIFVNQASWEKFWRSVNPKENPPVIDFKTQLVVVLVASNVAISKLDLNDGDVHVDAEATFSGDPTYHAVAFERKGVVTVRKMPLPKE